MCAHIYFVNIKKHFLSTKVIVSGFLLNIFFIKRLLTNKDVGAYNTIIIL